jgi:hypothetical protein
LSRSEVIINCINKIICTSINVFGTPRGIRTPDLRLRSPLLYPTELSGQVPCGAGYRSRTGLLGLENQHINRYTNPARITEAIISY